MMDIALDAYLLFGSIVVSYIFGRFSLRKGKYTGWYERFVDHSELIFLIQNAVIFFTSALCLVLLLYSVDVFKRERLIGAGIITVLVLYLLVILIVCVYNNLPKRMLFRKKSKEKATEEDNVESRESETNNSNNKDDIGIQPMKLLLRFLSVFSFVLGLCLFLFPFSILSCNSPKNNADSISSVMKNCCSLMINSHAPFSILGAFLLVLTSITGLILAAKTITLKSIYPLPGPTSEERKRNELQKRIRNR